jgi:nucleolar protein 56
LTVKTLGTKIFIVETLIGVFGVTEDNKIVEAVLYPRNPSKISAALDRQSSGEVSREVADAIEKLVQRGFDTFVFTNGNLAKTVRKKHGFKVDVTGRSGADDFIRENLEALAVEHGMVEDASQFYALSQKVTTLSARRAVQRAQSERSVIVTQATQLLNELDKTLNVLSNKLREWYGVHFPELSRHVDGHRTYAQLINDFGDRADIEEGRLKELGLDRQSKAIIASARESMGAPMAPDDIGEIKRLAGRLLSLYDYRPEVEAYLASTATEVAPNLSEVAGPVLAAKLIEKAGSLKKLAMMPSGTIQLLGAEKALFRSKKTGSKPPKHGLIFQHPYVHSKPRKLRGRSARTLASKLALAARADVFSGNPIGAELRRQLDEGGSE